MRNVYLDYSATTPVKEEVLKEMIPYFTEKFGNPSSLYDMGLESKEAVDKARQQVAALINADPSEIYFTAGGTEADNWAVFGTAEKFRAKGNHIITTKVEHHAMLHSCAYLEKEGYDQARIAKRTGLQPFVVRNYSAYGRKYRAEELEAIVQECVDTEEKVKTGRITDILSVELLLIKFSS